MDFDFSLCEVQSVGQMNRWVSYAIMHLHVKMGDILKAQKEIFSKNKTSYDFNFLSGS
jgi:hypothetical protein